MASSETTTTLGQRVFLWGIAVLMLLGTVASFVAMVVANDNQQKDQARYNELLAEYRVDVEEANAELSEKYFDILKGLSDQNVGEFDGSAVEELGVVDLKEGDGDDLTGESVYTAYYVGWTPDGKIFDQSIDGQKLKEPFTAYPGGVIEGWTNGVDGMKVGGARLLTIPSEQAYGEDGSGDSIPPNTPLRFIMLVIPEPDQVEPSAELLELNERMGAM